LPYRNVTEFDGPEEVQIERDERGEEGSDDGDCSPASADDTGAESMADDNTACQSHWLAG